MLVRRYSNRSSLGRIDLHVASSIEAGHRMNRIADFSEGAARVHSNRASDRSRYAHQRLQSGKPSSGERHQGPGEISPGTHANKFDVAVDVGLERLKWCLVESYDDAGNAIVIDQKIGAFAHDPKRGVDLSAPPNELGERFDGVRSDQEVGGSAGAEPTRNADRGVRLDLDVEVAEEASRGPNHVEPPRCTARSTIPRPICQTGPAPITTMRSPSRPIASSCSTIAPKGWTCIAEVPWSRSRSTRSPAEIRRRSSSLSRTKWILGTSTRVRLGETVGELFEEETSSTVLVRLEDADEPLWLFAKFSGPAGSLRTRWGGGRSRRRPLPVHRRRSASSPRNCIRRSTPSKLSRASAMSVPRRAEPVGEDARGGGV